MLVIGDNEYGIVDYSGLEAPEYEYDTETRLSGYGSTIRSRRIPEREITITAEYKSEESREGGGQGGSDEVLPPVQQRLPDNPEGDEGAEDRL